MIPTCDKIKVMHVITRFDKGGSAENTFLTLRDLDKNRYDLVLVTGNSPARDPKYPETAAIATNLATLCDLGVRVIHLPRLQRDLNPFSDLTAFVALLRLIRREKPQIVHTHTSKAGILGRWAAWFCRVPVIVHTPHGHVFWGYFPLGKTRLFIILERGTARITDMLVMLTEREKADHRHFGIAPAGKFTIIHSGVDLARFQVDPVRRMEMRAGQNIPPEATVIATAGRLTAVKGQETLLKAVAECRRLREEVFLLILGEGERRQDLEALAAALGITASVRFLGWRPDVAPVMDSCDIFCLPSLNEGMGKVLVEAMALGKPIIASDVGGIPDLVRPGENGLLVPPGDSAAWARAISGLIRDPEKCRRFGECGRQFAPRYSAEKMLAAIDRLYEKLLVAPHLKREPQKLS